MKGICSFFISPHVVFPEPSLVTSRPPVPLGKHAAPGSAGWPRSPTDQGRRSKKHRDDREILKNSCQPRTQRSLSRSVWREPTGWESAARVPPIPCLPMWDYTTRESRKSTIRQAKLAMRNPVRSPHAKPGTRSHQARPPSKAKQSTPSDTRSASAKPLEIAPWGARISLHPDRPTERSTRSSNQPAVRNATLDRSAPKAHRPP